MVRTTSSTAYPIRASYLPAGFVAAGRRCSSQAVYCLANLLYV